MRVPGAPLLERACLLIEAYRVHWRDTMVRADKSGDDDLYGEAAGPLYDCRAFQGAIDPERFDNAMREHGECSQQPQVFYAYHSTDSILAF